MSHSHRSIAKAVALYGMLIALAFILSFVETLIPISMGMPGVKLGLGNLVTIVGLYTVGIKGTVAVSLVRIILTGFTFGNLFSMFYSLGGWVVSMTLMTFAKRGQWFGTVGISLLGGVGHNVGQLVVAALVVKQAGIFAYLPVLLVSGTIAGVVIGILGGLVTERVVGIIKKL